MSGPVESQVCGAAAPREGVGACCRETGHGGEHWYWMGVNSGALSNVKSAIWLVDAEGKRIACGDFAGTYDEDCAIFLAAMIESAALNRADPA